MDIGKLIIYFRLLISLWKVDDKIYSFKIRGQKYILLF